MNLILPGRFNATVANGGYAAGKPYIIVKDTNVKNFLTSNNYFVADQLLVNGTTDIYFNPSTKFIDTNGTEIENRLVIPITTRGSRYNNQTITVTENNRNTSKVYMDRYEVDYKNKRIYIYMKTNKTEGSDTHTVSFTFGLDTNVTKTLELDYGYRTCTFTPTRNSGTSGSGFMLEGGQYYVSSNGTMNNSYSLITIEYECGGVEKLYIDYTNDGETCCDYSYIGLGNTFSLSNGTQSTYLKKITGQNTSGTYEYTLPSDTGSLDFKYRKDGGTNYGTDSFKFRIRY